MKKEEKHILQASICRTCFADAFLGSSSGPSGASVYVTTTSSGSPVLSNFCPLTAIGNVAGQIDAELAEWAVWLGMLREANIVKSAFKRPVRG